jgi:hypothetical protein
MPDPILPNLPINAEILIDEARAAREREAEEQAEQVAAHISAVLSRSSART